MHLHILYKQTAKGNEYLFPLLLNVQQKLIVFKSPITMHQQKTTCDN